MTKWNWGTLNILGLAIIIGASTGSGALGAAKKKATNGSATTISKGKGFVTADGCSGCHKIGAAGGTTGPDLTHVGSKLNLTQIEAKIKNPKAQNPQSIMPASKRSDKDIAVMAGYLASQK
jgi:mono/diheme cytochrome c family protein